MGELDDYLAGLEPDTREAFDPIVAAVSKLAPDAEQGRSYGMPAWRWHGRPLVAVAAARNHLSLFPFSARVVEQVAPQLDGYSISKGTIRFSEQQPLPVDVIDRVIRLRLSELDA